MVDVEELAGPLGDEKAAVRKLGQGPRIFQPLGHCFHPEAVRAGGHHLGREVAGQKDEKENGRPHGMDSLVRLGRLLEAKKQVAGAGD